MHVQNHLSCLHLHILPSFVDHLAVLNDVSPPTRTECLPTRRISPCLGQQPVFQERFHGADKLGQSTHENSLPRLELDTAKGERATCLLLSRSMQPIQHSGTYVRNRALWCLRSILLWIGNNTTLPKGSSSGTLVLFSQLSDLRGPGKLYKLIQGAC